ncbi:MocR-like pyridoxine biosynthesis transcription factor PdxR [Pseudomonas sp. SDO5271_S396]
MNTSLVINLDRSRKIPLAEQIHCGIATAIESGALAAGARLPSWRDLAAQLGVARGTIRAAYERLLDAQLIVCSKSRGTQVAARPALACPGNTAEKHRSPLLAMFDEFSAMPGAFQMGLPAVDCFPVKLFSRIRAQAVRAEIVASRGYPDPRGEIELRREIAAHLAVSRSIQCLPSQIVITAGFTGALSLALKVLRLDGRSAWMENPGFPVTRFSLQAAQLTPIPIPVDAEGLDVDFGMHSAPDAAVVVVTSGQQAPLGPTLSLERRLKLLDWASHSGAWVIEDDYLGELQLSGRAAPALSSLDRTGRVLHIGSFSKTISPTLRLGFIVVPVELTVRFAEAAICLAPAPGPAVQDAVAEFMRGGHYMRHLRRMKRVYASRRDALATALGHHGLSATTAGLAMLVQLPEGALDTLIEREAKPFGLTPSALSHWYESPDTRRSGLLLGVTAAVDDRLPAHCLRLKQLIDQFS